MQCYAGVLHVFFCRKVYWSPEATGLNQAQRGDGAHPGTKQLHHGSPPSDTLFKRLCLFQECPGVLDLYIRSTFYTTIISDSFFYLVGFSNSQGNSAYWLDPVNTNDVRYIYIHIYPYISIYIYIYPYIYITAWYMIDIYTVKKRQRINVLH